MNTYSSELIFRRLQHYPPALKQEGYALLEQLKKHPALQKNDLLCRLEDAEKILPLSNFLVSCMRKEPEAVMELAVSGMLRLSLRQDKNFGQAALAVKDAGDEETLQASMRSFRNKYMFKIAWRDIAGLSGLEETLGDLTLLADTCLNLAVDWHHKRLSQKYGSPLYPDGRPQNLIVLAMGKLGAGELNFSSDIDLIFAYPLLGNTSGSGKSISNEEFFTFLARKVIRTLSVNTEKGIVFRVDTRLRPFGDAGPLVLCADALEEYYENYGRQWERYAMVKARAAAGDIKAGQRLLKALRPFVYKKYLDYSTIESLRQMKAMIIAEHNREGIRDDIKLGPGGIRDVEFIVQTFQLLKGGRIPALQERYLLRTLEHIKRFSLLDGILCRKLASAYIFLRVVENRLQEYADQQVHVLPPDPDRQMKLAAATGFSSWEEFHSRLLQHMEEVHSIFTGLFSEQKETPVTEHDRERREGPWLKNQKQFKRLLQKCLLAWNALETEPGTKILSSLGMEKALPLLSAFRNSAKIKVLPGRTKEIVDELMPRVLAACAMTDYPDKALEGSLRIIEAVLRRSIYLMLLKEYPQALFHLVSLCSKSRWVSDLLSRQPILLDELIDTANLFRPLSRQEIRAQVSAVITSLPRSDMELFLDELRRIKKGTMLKIAACDLDEMLEIDQTGRMLTDLSEVLLETCLENALEYMLERQHPFKNSDMAPDNCGMAVICYGKMGGREMGYGSDLDLVFLYDAEGMSFLERPDIGGASYFFSRLVQRLIFLLTTRTSQGVLYQIDTRLRPNGSQGVLVSSIQGFKDYQEHKAWLWEHQAIIRARFAAGDKKTGNAFEDIRKTVLMTKREEGDLADQILDMRKRIARNVKKTGRPDSFDIKRDSGGIIDIEFLVQYLVLLNASRHEELTTRTGCLELLEILGRLGLLSETDKEILKESFRLYMKTINRMALDMKKPRVAGDSFKKERRQVSAIFNKFLGSAVKKEALP